MTVSYVEAETELKEHFYNHWRQGLTDNSVSLETLDEVAYTPIIEWPNKELKNSPPNDQHWLRFTTQNVTTDQSTINKPDLQRHETNGIIVIQFFFAKSSWQNSDRLLAQIAQSIFQGKQTPNGIWFRNAVIVDLDSEDQYFRTNVNVDYVYDSVNS